MSARPRAGSLHSMKAGACMKPDLGFFVGVFLIAPFDPVLIVIKGMPWEFMEINYFLRELSQHIV
jgi:hypothetical protein